MLGMLGGLMGGGGGGGFSSSSSASAEGGEAKQGDFSGGGITGSSGRSGFNVNFGGTQSFADSGNIPWVWLGVGAAALVGVLLVMKRR